MKKNAVQFLKVFHEKIPAFQPSPADTEVLDTIAKNHLLDLTTNLPGYFDESLREQVTQQAAEKLAEQVIINKNCFNFQLWHNVVADYHRNGYWGIQRLKTPPPPSPESEQSPTREMLKYIWVFVQAGILMKAVVLYFGLNAASDESSSASLFLYLALAFSFLSMAFFAWRLHRKEKKE